MNDVDREDPALAAAQAALAQRLHNLRKQAQWSQRELADRTGLTQTRVSRIERESRDISLNELLGLQRAFELASLEDLLAAPAAPVPTPSARLIAAHPRPQAVEGPGDRTAR
jgi:transcriptional regulator with XRE-family HTH domain